MQNIYGYILDYSFIETGFTEKGAKIAATRAGSMEVGYRSYITNMFVSSSYKKGAVWKSHEQQNLFM